MFSSRLIITVRLCCRFLILEPATDWPSCVCENLTILCECLEACSTSHSVYRIMMCLVMNKRRSGS